MMKIPTDGRHKPVFVCENYEQVDGRRAYASKTKGLSLGLTQRGKTRTAEVSAKIWQQADGKWQDDVQEIPIHQVIDLAILICRVKQHFLDAYRHEHFYDVEHPVVDRIGLQGDAMTVSVHTDSPTLHQDMQLFYAALAKDDELISERLRVLAWLLEEAGY